MRKAWTIIFFLLFLALPGYAEEEKNNWTKADTVRELTFVALHGFDWRQSRYIAKHPDDYYEINGLIGRHPSTSRVDKYFIITGAVHAGASYFLKPEWRKGWQVVTVAGKVSIISHNCQIGLTFRKVF